MKNRRVFQRAACSIPVVVHVGGRFVYGEVLDLSLGGVRLALQGKIGKNKVELTPNNAVPDGKAVIPLPYSVCWQDEGEQTTVGLQFTGGTHAFFRGWLADHLNPLLASHESLLDHRKLVRVPCQLDGTFHSENGDEQCAVMDLSLGGVSFVSSSELYPGETVVLSLASVPELGKLEAILLRVQPLTSHFLCGGKFLEVSAAQEKELRQLVAMLAKSAKSSVVENDGPKG